MMENIKTVHCNVYRITLDEMGPGANAERFDPKELIENDQVLGEFMGGIIQQFRRKKPSLSLGSRCKVWNVGEDNRPILDVALNTDEKEQFQRVADLIAENYTTIPKKRPGLLFVVNANVKINKSLTPSVFIIKADSTSAMDGSGVPVLRDVVLPDLVDALWYPHFDGIQFHFDQARIHKHQSSWFHKVLMLEPTEDQTEIADRCLNEALENVTTTHKRYFQIPAQDRHQKRDITGPARIVRNEDLIDQDQAAFVSRIQQQKILDEQAKPATMRLIIDSGPTVTARTDLLNQSFYLVEHGLEKFVVIRGNRIQTHGPTLPVEFQKPIPLETFLAEIGEA